jgi:outer membrane immunogenic protein
MKKLLLSSVALLGLSATAFAADLPSRRVAPAPYVAAPVFTWTGFYVGVNAGYGFTDNGNNNGSNYGAAPLFAQGPASGGGIAQTLTGGTGMPVYSTNNRNGDGFVGGGQVGYNFQFGNVVVGIEADAQYADFGKNRNGALSGGTDTVTPGVNVAAGSPNVTYFNTGLFSRNSADWFGTVRGRLGYAWDRVLVYGTGGLAFTDSGNNNGSYGSNSIPTSFFVGNAGSTQAQNAAAGNFYASNARGQTQRMDNIGYAVGGGVEYAFTPNLTGKIEGLYVNFGTTGNNYATNSVVGVTNLGVPVVSPASYGNSRNKDVDFAVVRAGLNYKFNLF